MMKHYYNQTAMAAILCMTFAITGCDDFLDIPPTTNVAIPSSAADYRKMLYPLGLHWSAEARIGVMGDDVYWSSAFYREQAEDETYRRSYLWKDEVFDLSIIPEGWSQQYKFIYTFNKIINEVRYISGEAMGNLIDIESEARLYRALIYFHLVNLYAKPYTQATDSDSGIPVILENNVTETNRSRTPVREVYAFILNDLDSAIRYLPDYPSGASRFLACRIGGYGMKARTLFLMGQYDEALDNILSLLDILTTKPAPFDFQYSLLDYNTLALMDDSQPWMGMDWNADFPSSVFEPNPESVFTSTLYIMDPTLGYVYGGMNAVFASDHVMKLFSSEGDLRKKYMLPDKNMFGEPWDPAEPERFVKCEYYSNAGVSLPDIYLMAAECYARKNDVDNALVYLNELRKNRVSADVYSDLSSNDDTQVLTWVLEERMREFLATGHRWYDMRRLWDDPVGGKMIEKNRIFDGQTYTLTKDRLTVRIPEYIMQYHADWVQHP
ncbi:MAG: RagB/SusD family nutrient uptake outer membrane protein [Tannerellaceae bacterium]|jgi:tetratricopeptide (TPR) repeat protein|nr:RagB/SusD family nutrient uptake outer membrane protein [Tannerellaceae bacterium]